MNSLKKQLDSLMEKAVNRTVKKEMEDWPPITIPLFFQPQRPDRPAEDQE